VGAQTDLPLTEQGRNQAESFAHYLASQKIQPQAIYAGSLKRQTETAEILRSQLQIEHTMHAAALTEIDYGAWEGLTTDAIRQKWPNEYEAWIQQSRWPKIFGNTKESHLAAIKKWLNELRDTYAPDETVVGVTSNGILRFFYNSSSCDLKVKTGHFCELWLFKNSVEIKSWNKDPKQGRIRDLSKEGLSRQFF
jgi:probable phosphoglycerate mutase